MDWVSWFAHGKRFSGWCPFCDNHITLVGMQSRCPECKKKLTQLRTNPIKHDEVAHLVVGTKDQV